MIKFTAEVEPSYNMSGHEYHCVRLTARVGQMEHTSRHEIHVDELLVDSIFDRVFDSLKNDLKREIKNNLSKD